MAQPAPKKSGAKGKLPSIPQSKPGERPYYCEAYCKLAKACIGGHEALKTMRELLWSSNTVYTLNNFKSHNFVPNEKMQSCMIAPLVNLSKVESWEKRTESMKEFVKSVLPVCEQAVYAAHRLFKNRSPPPSTLIPVDTSTSYIAADIGVFIHVWTSHKDAKMFVNANQNLQQRIHDLRIDTISCPFTAMVSIQSITVTATPLMPITSEKPMKLDNCPILSHVLEQLEVYCRAKEPLKLYHGADGRFYVMEMDAVLHNEGESNGEFGNTVRQQIIDRYPNSPAALPQAMNECMLKEAESVIQDLVDAVNAKGETCGGVINVKIQELVMEKIVAKKCHARGFKICYLFTLYNHPKLQGDGAEAVIRETLAAEMVCRTMKEIMRAEIATVPMVPNPDAPIATASSFVVELLNRCTFSLLVKQELWEPHFLAVLRLKFRTPDSFVISQIAVTKRTVLAYLTTRLGPVFEQGKFNRVAPINITNTLPKPCEVTKMVLSNQRTEAHQMLLNQWKRTADVRAPSLQVCTMIHQVALFALARSISLDWFINLLNKKINDLEDKTVETVVRPVIIEAMGELPEADKFRAALVLYLSNNIKSITEDKKAVYDAAVAGERFRHAGMMLANIERGREKDAVGELNIKASKLLTSQPGTVERLTKDTTVNVVAQSMNYAYTVKDKYFEVEPFWELLQHCFTTPERYTALCEKFQYFAGGSLAPGYTPPTDAAEIFRKVAQDNQHKHHKHFGESDQKYHIALLLAACHWGDEMKPGLTKDENKAMEKFREATIRIHGALVSEQKSMLRGEWYVAMTGPAATVLMDHGEWATAQYIIGFGHNVLSEGHFKSKKGKITTAVLPELEMSTRQLLIAVNAAERLQRQHRKKKRMREEAEAKAKEDAAHAAELHQRRLELCDTVIAPERLVAAAKQCVSLASRSEDLVVPPLMSLFAKRAHNMELFGLKALLCVTSLRRTANLAAVAIQSGTFPPFKWTITPHASGVRNIVVVPDTECLGSWWRRTWLQRAEFMESHCPLFAKVAACYIFSQHKYTFLSWNVIGFSWAGCIAQCLSLLIPGDTIEGLFTFGSPPCFTKVRDFMKIPNAHIIHEEDVTPRLLGCIATTRARQCLLSRLEGMGALLPDPPTESDLDDHSYLVNFGRHTQELRGDGEAHGKVKLMDVDSLASEFDVRNMFPNFTAAMYHGLLFKASGKDCVVPPRYRPPMKQLVLDSMNEEGEPEERLLEAINIPDGVELIASKPQYLLLAYPKVGQSLIERLSVIPEEYGMEMMPPQELVDNLEKCRTVGALTEVLASFLGASWDSSWCAHQLFELSGIGAHAEHSMLNAADKEGKDSKAHKQRAMLRRQSSMMYGNTLSSELIEMFVEKHNFLFQVAPQQEGGGHEVRRADGGTPMYIDNVDERMRKLLAGPDGYHLGWCVAVASTVRSIGKTTLINALANASFENSMISLTHKRTSGALQIPSIRMRWRPKNRPPPKPSPGASPNETPREPPLFLQMHFQEVRWDGKMAAQTLMRTAAQIVWLVVDSYTFRHLISTVKFSPDTLSVIVYAPRFSPESEVVQEIKDYCLANSMLFTIVDSTRTDSIEGLQRLLVYWMCPSFHFPINPMQLPAGVEVGALYSRSEEQVQEYVNHAVRPTFGNMFLQGGAGSTANNTHYTGSKAEQLADPFAAFAQDANLNGEDIRPVKNQHGDPGLGTPRGPKANKEDEDPFPPPPSQKNQTPMSTKSEPKPVEKSKPPPSNAPPRQQEKKPAPAQNSMRAAARAAKAEFEAEERRSHGK